MNKYLSCLHFVKIILQRTDRCTLIIFPFPLAPPAYYQTEDPNVQTTFTYGNQYHQYQRGSQYPSPHDAQNTDNQHQPQYNARGHVVTTMVQNHMFYYLKKTLIT